jgi:beta-galactosidase
MADGHRRQLMVRFMTFALAGALLFSGGSLPLEACSAPMARQTVDLGEGWRFHRGDADGARNIGHDDSAWERVSVPHTWNAEDGQDGGGDYYRGIGWYRRHVMVANTVTLHVNGVQVGPGRSGADRAVVWPGVLLRPGLNIVMVSGLKDGRRYTDRAMWTVAR